MIGSRGATAWSVLSALALGVGPVQAQVVQGRVTDATGEQPLPAAEISLIDEEGRVAAVTLSDSTGRYRIGPPEPGSYVVRVDLLGYERLVSPLLALVDERVVNADFEVPAQPIGLEGLHVEVEAEEQIRRGLRTFGVNLDDLGERFVNRAMIQSKPFARDFGHVLQWQGGVSVTRTDDLATNLQPLHPTVCVRVTRRTNRVGCALVALNGVLITNEAATMISPDALEAMVVLTPAEATLAFGTDADGGAVLLFTRGN